MPQEIKPIQSGFVNCYLVRTDTSNILIDTGLSTKRDDLDIQLEHLGCTTANLKLIILTHGDFDHTSNGAYLRNKYNTTIAMHCGDVGMVEQGNMLWNRKAGKIRLFRIIMKALLFLFRMGKFDRFKPNVLIDEGDDISGYGFDARVLYLPGHSKGSIGILTAGGDLFCGDLLMNIKKPEKSSLVDDAIELTASIEKLNSLGINTVYPGHGKPFPMGQFQ